MPLPRERPGGKSAHSPAAKSTPKAAEKAADKKPADKKTAQRPAVPLRIAPGASGSSAPVPVSAVSGAIMPPAPPARAVVPFAAATGAMTSQIDLSAVKQAIDLVRKNRQDEATTIEGTISDPIARKLVEWVILRSDDGSPDFSRYLAFIAANPSWPSITTLRRRAEGVLWQERADPQTVIRFFATEPPHTVKGHFALAQAFLAQGNSAAAASTLRDTWRSDGFSSDLEAQARETFAGLITPADDAARMDARLYAEDDDGGLRAASHLDATALAVAKARAAVINQAANAKALLEGVPEAARHDPGYIFSRIQWLRRNDKMTEAAQWMAAAPRDPSRIGDPDQWWIERRMIARKLLDLGDARMAYEIADGAAPPNSDNYRSEQHFTAGWIALRFLREPAAALQHFARIADGATNPIPLARSYYWQGRALEALGRDHDAREFYEAAAHYPTAYYGQLARARLGLNEVTLSALPEPAGEHRPLEIARVFEILYAIDERDLVAAMAADLGDKATDTVGSRDTRRAYGAPRRRARDAPDRQNRARPRLSVRALCVSRFRHAAISADRPGGRTLRRVFDRAPGKRVQSEGRLQRQCDRPDAGHAGRGTRYRQTLQRHLRSAPADERRRLQCPARHRRARPRHRELARLLYPRLCRL